MNSVEWAWHHLKNVELRNVTSLHLDELQMQLDVAIARLRQTVNIVRTFFAGAGLSF